MYTVYVLALELLDGFYVGFSGNFNRRLEQHKTGCGAIVTKKYGVRSVVHIEEAPTVVQAKVREKELQEEYSKRSTTWGADEVRGVEVGLPLGGWEAFWAAAL